MAPARGTGAGVHLPALLPALGHGDRVPLQGPATLPTYQGPPERLLTYKHAHTLERRRAVLPGIYLCAYVRVVRAPVRVRRALDRARVFALACARYVSDPQHVGALRVAVHHRAGHLPQPRREGA